MRQILFVLKIELLFSFLSKKKRYKPNYCTLLIKFHFENFFLIIFFFFEKKFVLENLIYLEIHILSIFIIRYFGKIKIIELYIEREREMLGREGARRKRA